MDKKLIKEILLNLKLEVQDRMSRTHKHIYGKQEAVSADFHEQVKEMENDQLVYTLEEESKYELKQIDQALKRLDEGNYFTCSSCGKEINKERLEAVPFTDQCIQCA